MEGIASPAPTLGGEEGVGVHDCKEPVGQGNVFDSRRAREMQR